MQQATAKLVIGANNQTESQADLPNMRSPVIPDSGCKVKDVEGTPVSESRKRKLQVDTNIGQPSREEDCSQIMIEETPLPDEDEEVSWCDQEDCQCGAHHIGDQSILEVEDDDGGDAEADLDSSPEAGCLDDNELLQGVDGEDEEASDMFDTDSSEAVENEGIHGFLS